MWFRVASLKFEMFQVVSCGQGGTGVVSCGFVWPAWKSRCFMWLRVASVVVEMFHVASVDVVSCGQRRTRGDASCGFV